MATLPQLRLAGDPFTATGVPAGDLGPLAAAPGAAVLPLLATAVALALALVHLFAGRLLVVRFVPRSRWLSLAGGVSVAYVFVHVLPELRHAGAAVDASGTTLTAVESHVYLVVLLGFTVFYGLEQFVRGAAGRGDETDDDSGVFWLHVGSFAAYNALVGYLLFQRDDGGLVGLALFGVALALHFFVNDYGLRDRHGRAYHRYGRWVLSAAILAGAAVGYLVTVPEVATAVLFAFLAGGIVLNAVKEELPAERESRFWAFAAGAVGYAAVLVVA